MRTPGQPEPRRGPFENQGVIYLNSGDLTEEEAKLNDNKQVVQLTMKPYDELLGKNTVIFSN